MIFFNYFKKNKIIFKNIKVLLSLIVFYLIIKISILFSFQGILGGDESYSICSVLNSILKLNIPEATYKFINYFHIHQYINAFFQLFFTFPFYCIFPTNEFASFLGIFSIDFLLFIFIFITLQYYYNFEIAVLCSLLYIFSPIGYTIATISSNYGSISISLLILLLLHYVQNKNLNNIILYLVIFSLSITYGFILIISYIIFTLTNKKIKTNKYLLNNFSNLNILSFIIILSFFIFFLLMTFLLFKSGKFHLTFPTINRVKEYIYFLKQPFLATDIAFFNNFSIISSFSFYSFIFLLLYSIKYIFFDDINNTNKNITLKIYSIFLILFLIVDLISNNQLNSIIFKTLNLKSYYLSIFIFIAFVLIAYTVYYKKQLRYFYFVFILSNLFIIFNIINPISKNNNFINYNTGNNPYYSDSNLINIKLIGTNNSNILNSLKAGFYSREFDISKIDNSKWLGLGKIEPLNYSLDYILYGYGLKLYYHNNLGVNFCNILNEKNKISKCKIGYSFSSKDVIKYIQKMYNINNHVDILIENIDPINKKVTHF